MAIERLQKVIARAGISSRRKAEQLIVEGRVTVNGRVINTLGAKVNADNDCIKVDGRQLPQCATPKHYFLAFKPQKMITSLRDPQGRPTITDLLHAHRIHIRVFPVGRLDWDSDGLLLLTNDGRLANMVMHPSTHLKKVYRIKVKGIPSKQSLKQIESGMVIRPGVHTLPAKVVKERKSRHSTWLRITLIEGKQNQIKKMFEQIGHPVYNLRRIAIGPLHLGRLRPGEIKRMTSLELKRLKKALGIIT